MQFSDIITFTRASGGGRFNAQGVYEWLPANQPRFDYDPVTGEAKGLLIEEQRTNLLTYSVNPIQQANTVLAAPEPRLPDHVGYSRAGAIDSAAVAMTAGTAYVASVYVRIEAVTTAGSVTASISGAALGAAQVVTAADVGRLFRLSSGAYTPGTNISLRARATPTDGITISVFAAQIEAGSFPTSYIPTTTAQVTRAADIASVNELSPWYRADEGTLFVEAVNQATAGQRAFCTVDDGTLNNRIELALSVGGSGRTQVVVGGVSVADINGLGTPIASGGVGRMSAAFAAGHIIAALNGTLSAQTAIVSIPAVTKLVIGGRSSFPTYFNGHIRVIKYLPKRVSNSELQAMTQV